MQTDHFSPDSKVWVYQSSRPFTVDEAEVLTHQLNDFARDWTAHQQQLNAAGFLYTDRIIVLMVDETHAGTSGCSIDTSVRFLKSIEQQYNVELFDRMLVNYFDEGIITTTTLAEVGKLSENTSVIDPLVTWKKDFDQRLIVPLKESWMHHYAN